MELVIANIESTNFKIEYELNEQIGALPLPFSGMDKSTSAVCSFFNAGQCDKEFCPFRHVKAESKTIVCKHWLRALCKKGDSCEFLHEYDMSKMPECYFYSRFNTCHKKECTFLHIDPESKIKDCPWYDRGFCRHGPNCRHRHVRRVLCKNYLSGFCPDGKSCKHMHPRFELPPAADINKDTPKRAPTCHNCGELGHKASFCPKLAPEQREAQQKIDEQKYRQIQLMKQQNPQYNHHLAQKLREQENQENNGENLETSSLMRIQPHQPPGTNMMSIPPPMNNPGGFPGMPPPRFQSHNPHHGNFQNHHQPRQPFQQRKLEEITCFKCGAKGHYANRCYSFLNSNFAQNNNPK